MNEETKLQDRLEVLNNRITIQESEYKRLINLSKQENANIDSIISKKINLENEVKTLENEIKTLKTERDEIKAFLDKTNKDWELRRNMIDAEGKEIAKLKRELEKESNEVKQEKQEVSILINNVNKDKTKFDKERDLFKDKVEVLNKAIENYDS